jgi:acetoin utilization protein AcuB
MRHMPIDPRACFCAPQADALAGTRVRDRMTRLPITVPPATTVTKARALMRARRIRHLPVVDGDRVVGIVSDRDLRGRAATEELDAVMSTPVVSLPPDADVCEAARLFHERGIGAVVVIEGERLVGVLTRRDLMAVLTELEAHRRRA